MKLTMTKKLWSGNTDTIYYLSTINQINPISWTIYFTSTVEPHAMPIQYKRHDDFNGIATGLSITHDIDQNSNKLICRLHKNQLFCSEQPAILIFHQFYVGAHLGNCQTCIPVVILMLCWCSSSEMLGDH